MLNLQPIVYSQKNEVVENKMSIFETIEHKQYLTYDFCLLENGLEVEIKKQKFERFSIIIKNINFYEKEIIISLNNKINFDTQIIYSKPNSEIIIWPYELNNTVYSDVSTISVAVNIVRNFSLKSSRNKKKVRISELCIKLIKNSTNNQTWYIDKNGLIVEWYSSIRFIQQLFSVIVKTEKQSIKILPKKLEVGKHNVELLIIENKPKVVYPKIIAKSVEGLQISSKKQITKFVESSSQEETLNNISGKIIFDQNTYYSFKDKKTNVGIGENSKKGYIIPYTFKGTIIPIITLDIGYEKNILIGYSSKISNPYFDKYSGKIKLKISLSNELFDDLYDKKILIKNENFPDIILGNLTLQEINELSSNEKKW